MRNLVLLAAFAGTLAAQAPVRILVAYHSPTGNTEKLAREVAAGGSAVAGVEIALRKIAEVQDEDFLRAQGIVVGTPVHWSNVSEETRRFLDRVGNTLWKAKMTGDGRTAGAFCTAGGTAIGKDVTRLSILSAFLTMRFVVVGGVDHAGFGTLGPEATTGEADPGLSAAELAEARRYGERFARLTLSVVGRAPWPAAEPQAGSRKP